MSNNGKKAWYDIPPTELVKRVNNNNQLHENVKRDILELYKNNKDLATGIVDQIEKYIGLLLNGDTIKRIEIKTIEVAGSYDMIYVSGKDKELPAELYK